MLRPVNFLRPRVTKDWLSRRLVYADSQDNARLCFRVYHHSDRRCPPIAASAVGSNVLGDPALTASNSSIKQTSVRLVLNGIQCVLPSFTGDVAVSETPKVAFGDYQCNIAMQLFSTLPPEHCKYSTPRELAQIIVDELELGEVFEKVTVAGPGFINLFLSTDYILNESKKLLFRISEPPLRQHKKVIVDFSSPNIAKEMHVGHLRSTIIGDSLCRALEYRGFDVSRLNHVGDWGTQFGMLITYMHDQGSESTENVPQLQTLYKAAKVKFDSDADFKRRSQIAVTKLQSYDSELIEMWKKICSASRAEFEAIYDLLDIRIEERGESFYNSMIPDVLTDLVSKGIAVEDEGALCVFVENSVVPLICRKSDGAFNYASTDLAALYHRTQIENADWIIYVTDISQRAHFDAVFEAGRRAGWLQTPKPVLVNHVGFGLVTGEDGKRLRTRSGDTVRLKDLLLESKERCLQQFILRNTDLDRDTIENSAADMGIGAVKYADLRNNMSTNYTFSFDRMLDLKGNTAVYLQYTMARINSIVQRANDEGKMQGMLNGTSKVSPSERALMLHLLRFDDAVDCMVEELKPSKLCDYAYNLCVVFNNFYSECKVFGSDEEEARLMMCALSLKVLHRCFTLIGIRALDKL